MTRGSFFGSLFAASTPDEASEGLKRENLEERIWMNILENWEEMYNFLFSIKKVDFLCVFRKKSTKVKSMRRSGITPNMRGKVWEKAIGNRLQMTEKLYHIYTAHAQKNREKTLNDINTHSNARLIGKKGGKKFLL